MHRTLTSSFASTSCVALLFTLASCGGGGDETESVGCPAIVLAAEPSLIIASVQNAVSSAPVQTVVLSDIKRDGMSHFLGLLPREASNVRVVGNTVECTVPCGFATSEGAFTFTVAAAGYLPRQVAAQGAYSSSIGTCPPSLTGGKRISVNLQPA